MKYKIEKYSRDFQLAWDDFIENSRNGTFLLKREFMEYHSHKFIDSSIIVFSENKIVALLPANLSNNIMISHQGLTYGGLICEKEIKQSDLIFIVSLILHFLSESGINKLIIKPAPRFYNSYPSDDLDWVYFKLNAKLIRRDSTYVICNLNSRIEIQERRKRSIKKGKKLNFVIKEGFDQFKPFWSTILIPNLQEKYGVQPVHSISEIEMLASKFQLNIKQFNILNEDQIIAGCTIFETENVAHAQYISGSEFGRNSGCLDLLFDWLINERYKGKMFFDFGIANEELGQKINKGLMDWKEGFGARAISHDFYEIETMNFALLENIYN